MKPYVLKKLNDDNIPYLVLSTNYLTPGEYLEELSEVLQRDSYVGQVLFDLLVTNGPKDRYYKAFFNGTNFELESFKKSDVKEFVIEIANNFFKENYSLIENSTMNDFYKYLIKKGKLRSIC